MKYFFLIITYCILNVCASQEDWRNRIEEELGIESIDTLQVRDGWVKKVRLYPSDSLMQESFYLLKVKAKGQDSLYTFAYKENQYFEDQKVSKKIGAKYVSAPKSKLIYYVWLYNRKGKLLSKEKVKMTIN